MDGDSARLTAQALREADRDRYFATLVLPEAARPAVQALFAFSADVASVRDKVSNPAAGEIRLQWWHDALTGPGHGSVRANPVADALLSAISRYGLSTVPLLRLVAARRFDLYQDPMPDMLSFEGYAGETASVLFQYAAMILNGGQEVPSGDAAGHLGVAQALVGHLRAFGFNAAQGRLFLPLDYFAAHGVSEGEIFSGQAGDGLRAARQALIQAASGHLAGAEQAIRAAPRPLRAAFALLPVLQFQLKQLDNPQQNPFAAPPDLADWRKIALLGLWAWRNARGKNEP